jgi:hypothetical protein
MYALIIGIGICIVAMILLVVTAKVDPFEKEKDEESDKKLCLDEHEEHLAGMGHIESIQSN